MVVRVGRMWGQIVRHGTAPTFMSGAAPAGLGPCVPRIEAEAQAKPAAANVYVPCACEYFRACAVAAATRLRLVPDPGCGAHPLPSIPSRRCASGAFPRHSETDSPMRLLRHGLCRLADLVRHHGPRPQGTMTVKIGWIDPLSGLMAPVGQNQLKTWQFPADAFPQTGPMPRVKFEVRAHRNNKLSPREEHQRAQSRHRPGRALHVVQGNGSGAAWRRRGQAQRAQPRQGTGCTSTTPRSTLTSQQQVVRCNSGVWMRGYTMKMEALTAWVKDQPDIKKIHLINQNPDSHGQQVQFAKGRSMAQAARCAIVGDDLHRWRRCDFARMWPRDQDRAPTRCSPATGPDLTLLIKAANDAGLNVKFSPTTPRSHRHADGAGWGAAGASARRATPTACNMPGEINRTTTSRPSSTTTCTPWPPTTPIRC